MSACPLLERASANFIGNMDTNLDGLVGAGHQKPRVPNPMPIIVPGGPGPGGGGGGGVNGALDVMMGVHPDQIFSTYGGGGPAQPVLLEKDYYGCYCLKFIVKNGTHITEEKVQEDFGQFGEVVDIRGPGLFSGLRGNHVYVRFIDKTDAETALRHLVAKYHQLTPASISDVLPDNYGLYTISFYNKTGIPSTEVRREFSKFGEVKNLTGSLDVKGGRVFVSYKEKTSAVQALQAFFFRKDRYPNMKFALPRCEKDYFGCYCLKFYNKSGDVTEEKVLSDFGHFGEVVDVRGPGLFDVTGDDVYVRYKEKSSAEQALIELVGKYDSLCLAPPSDIQADKFGYFTITFVNDKCLSKSDVWYIFSKFGTVACVNGTFDCKKGRVFVSYKEKQGALNALETMLITKEYHLQVSKNSTVRKNDYNVIGGGSGRDMGGGGGNLNGDLTGVGLAGDFGGEFSIQQPPPPLPSNLARGLVEKLNGGSGLPPPPAGVPPMPVGGPQPGMMGMGSTDGGHVPVQHQPNEQGRSRNSDPAGAIMSAPAGLGPVNIPPPTGPPPCPPGELAARLHHHQQQQQQQSSSAKNVSMQQQQQGNKNGMVKFNRNVEKDIFGYFCLSFLNEDGDINEKKVRHDFGKFGEVVSVRGALGKQKGHVFVRFRRKEAAENCLNCLNSFPLSEMSELFGKYLFLSPATPRDIDCDMYGLYSISFLNLNMKTFREIRQEFAKFGEIVRLTSGGGGNTDELVSISYTDKPAAIKALQTHFTNKEFPYLDIAKGSSLLLVNSSDSSDNEDNESDYILNHHREAKKQQQQHHGGSSSSSSDPFHDPSSANANGIGGSDVVDELLKPLQSYFSIYRTGQYQSLHPPGCEEGGGQPPFANGNASPPHPASRSPDKKYRIKSVKQQQPQQQHVNGINGHHHQQQHRMHRPPPPPHHPPPNTFSMPPPPQPQQQSHRQQQHSDQTAMQHRNSIPETTTTTTALSAATTTNRPTTSASDPTSLAAAAVATTPIESTARFNTSPDSSPAHGSPERDVWASEQQANDNDASATISTLQNTKVESQDGSETVTSFLPDVAVSEEGPYVPEEKPQVEKQDPTNDDREVSCSHPLPTIGADSEIHADAALHADPLGFYSLSFANRTKDLTERKLRLDFGTEVARVRGLGGTDSDSVTLVSFESEDAARAALTDNALQSKYHCLRAARPLRLVADRDGEFSIEFMNSGMNGVREITNEFSRHGEVVKVMAGGAKNAVKRVTVSYADAAAATAAVKAYRSSKDFVSVDFSRECLVEQEGDSDAALDPAS